MGSMIDEDIRLAGRAATIIRTGGNISTYVTAEATGQDSGRKRLEPQFGFDYAFRFMTTSGILSGDLVQIGTDYFLVIVLEPKYVFAALEYYRATLYKCNSVVSIYYLNSSTKRFDTVYKSGVHCLITQVRAREWDEDRALVMPNRSYRGSVQPFQIYAKSSEGFLTEGCMFEDASGRRFRIGKESDPFLAENIFQAEVIYENN